jgi:hypothetical protein
MDGIVKASIDPVAATQGGVTLLQGLDQPRHHAPGPFLPPRRTAVADRLVRLVAPRRLAILL